MHDGASAQADSEGEGTTVSIVTDKINSITSIAAAMTGPAEWRRRNITAAPSAVGMTQPRSSTHVVLGSSER